MPNGCTGLFCRPEVIGGAVVLGLLAMLIGGAFVRAMSINRTRRARGLAPLRFAEVLNLRMSGKQMRVIERSRVVRANEEQRQIDWEKEQAAHELIRTGQHIQRQFCSHHQRWCFHAWEDDHPPGGFDNPTVPDDWPPDLTRDAR